MHILKGIPISPGYAEGTAVIYDYEVQHRLEIPRFDISVSDVQSEHRRLSEARDTSHSELAQAKDGAHSGARHADTAALLSAHSALVSEVAERVHEYVRREQVNVEQALEAVINDLSGRLGQLENAHLREREQDIRDVGRRMLRHLFGAPASLPVFLPARSVLVARELLPSEALELTKSGLIAIVTDQGGKNSHTAILARSLGIPAITGIANVTAQIQPGVHLLVDACAGTVAIAPSPDEIGQFSERKREYENTATTVADADWQPCVTRDGVPISLYANIGRPEEVAHVREHHLDGIGLFRTEFLFLESREPPDFQMQIDTYRRAADFLGGRPLVIRTFDLGGDKTPPFLLSDDAGPHPSLALRGLRFSLAESKLFETQLRAIVQIAQDTNTRILFPMVIGRHDLSRACTLLSTTVRDLGVQRKPLVGAMIETPAALFALEEILELADFMAIGTNDLSQYMLALDRDEADMSEECTPWHPLVLRAISQVVEAAALKSCPVSVCGEEAGEPEFACLLAGLGVRELSLDAARATNVCKTLQSIDCQDMQELAAKALSCSHPDEVRQLFAELSISARAGMEARTSQH